MNIKLGYPKNRANEMPRRIAICCEMREGEENDTFIYEYTSVLYSITEINTLFISNIHARLIDNIL